MKKKIIFSLLAGSLAITAFFICTPRSPLIQEANWMETPAGDTTMLWPARDSINLLWGCVNQKGEWVIPAQFDYIHPFSCGYAPCSYNGLCAYLSTDGKIHYPVDVTANENNEFDCFHYGYAVIKWTEYNTDGESTDRCILIDTTMHRVIPDIYSDMSCIGANGLIAVQWEPNGLYGYINKEGKIIIQPQYEYAVVFQNGYAPVMKNGSFGLIDIEGNFVIEPQYVYLWSLGPDRWAAMGNEQQGECVLDSHGNTIVPFGLYDNYYPANDQSGIISCHDVINDFYGWIKPDGEVHCTCCFTLTEPYSEGYALGVDIVTRDTFVLYVVDKRGVITNSDTIAGYFDDDTRLHNRIIDLRYLLSESDYAGMLLTLQSDTIHQWICHQ